MKPSNPTKLALKLSVLGMSAVLATTAFLAAPRYTANADWNTNHDAYILKNEEGAAPILKEPANCTVNLIDYWWSGNATTPTQFNDENNVSSTSGINANHYLTFGSTAGAWNTWTKDAVGTSKSGSTQGAYYNLGLDGNADTGVGKAYRGIVNYNLGDDGYPRLSLGEYAWTGTVETDFNNRPNSLGTRSGGANESLAYLFDPHYSQQNYRRGMADVKGLFRYGGTGASGADMTGYYWYDSTVNFAELYSTYKGEPFDYYATSTTADMIANGEYTFRLYSSALEGNDYAGQFFPLNYVERGTVSGTNRSLFSFNSGMRAVSTAWRNGSNNKVNHHFGMSMEVEFMQPAGYNVDGKDMTFTFAGDDDVWIFCDDVLIADLGGNHSALACDINFSTGEIIYYASQQGSVAENAVWRVDYLSNCFGVDLDYGREVKGWYTEDGWTVPATDAELQDYYMKEYKGGQGWLSGRSGEQLNFYGASREKVGLIIPRYEYQNLTAGSNSSGATASNAWHAGVPATQFGTFEELTRHTLKFFFLESGGNMSNCMLKFNLSAIAE